MRAHRTANWGGACGVALLLSALSLTARAASVTLDGDLAVDTVTVQTGGAFHGNGWAVTVSSDAVFASGAAFDAGGGTFTFAGAAGSTSTLTGSATFYNFMTQTPGKWLRFEAGATTTVQGRLMLEGASGNNV